MASLVSANVVSTGQVQSLDSLRGHSLPSDALIFASGTQVNPANQNLGSYSFRESGVNSLGVTTTGSVPAVTQSPFADLYKEGSVYFNGTAGNYLQNTATYSNNTIQWNTAGMTIEAWVNYPTFTGGSVIFGSNPQPTLVGLMQATGGGNILSFGANTTGYVNFFYYNGTGQTVMSTTQLSTNTWNHIAMTCSTSGQIFLFVNGVQTTVYANRNGTIGSAVNYETVQGTPGTGSFQITVGQFTSAVNAYVADLRLTTGTPVYTGSTGSLATFTVPSAPLSSTTSPGVTQFLLRAGNSAPTLQNGALTFDRGLAQFYNFGPQTFNIVTQGFTAIWRGAFTGTPGSYERIFEFGAANTSTGGSIAVMRGNLSNNIIFYIFPTNSSTQYYVTTTNFVTQGTNYVIAIRYNPSTQIADVWVNGVLNTSGTITTAQMVADRTVAFTYLSKASDGSPNGQYTSNTLAIYNRALSNTEIYNSYLALSTTPQNPQNSTLEIGDVNGTPALRITGDGRVNIQKLGASSNVLPWPPSAMTGYVTSINGGTYVASASTDRANYPAWQAFDKSTSSVWLSVGSVYSGTSPYAYIGSVSTSDVNGTSYLGEWIQVQLPSSIVLTNYNLSSDQSTDFCTLWSILGSRDGVNWFLVNKQNISPSSVVGGTTYSYTVSSGQAFSYFRMVVSAVSGSYGGSLGIAEWILYGTTDLQQPLSVTQPLTLNYGAQTSSLVGIPNPGVYAPQDFSSSALNIPAYVVSNTATVANTVAFSEFGPFAGEGSLYFPGAAASSGAYINFPAGTPIASINPVTAFMAEAWLYLVGTPTPTYCGIFDHTASIGGSENWGLNLNGTNATFFIWPTSGSASQITGSATLINSWFHIAVSYDGTTLRLFINGALSNSTAMVGTPRLAASSIFLVGTNGVFRTGCPMYMADARVVTGSAIYTGAFTPPTAPLQPLQGTTQAGLPYGTVLLLRNAPAPGRVLTQKFAGQNSFNGTSGPSGLNSSGVLSFPPAAMTGYSTSLSSGYGQGTYVASASSEYAGNLAWYPFQKLNTGYQWSSGVGNPYNATSPYASVYGYVLTTDIAGNSYNGEWLQIQSPSSLVLSSYQIQPSYYSLTTAPAKWSLLGSRDGTNWYLVDSRSGYTFSSVSAVPTFTVSAGQAFTYFRIVVIQLAGNGQFAQMTQFILNGSIEGPTVSADGRLGVGVSAPVQQLEVAGSAVVAGTVSSGSPFTFKNALYNGSMVINQRGISTSWASPTAIGTSITTYTTDRWNVFRVAGQTGSAVAQVALPTTDAPYFQGLQYYLRVGRVTGDTGTNQILCTYQLETRDSLRFAGQPTTVSFWYRTGSGFSGTFQVSYYYGTGTDQAWRNGPTGSTTVSAPTFPNSNAWQYVSTTGFVSLVANQLFVGIVYSPGGTAGTADYFDITGVQLEKGTIATPYEVRPYATELALCQRYYYRLTAGSSNQNISTGIGVSSSNLHRFQITTPVLMRTTNPMTIYTPSGSASFPSSSLTLTSSELYAWNGGSNQVVTLLSAADWGSTNTQVISFLAQTQAASTASPGLGQLFYLNYSGSYLALSAEL